MAEQDNMPPDNFFERDIAPLRNNFNLRAWRKPVIFKAVYFYNTVKIIFIYSTILKYYIAFC